MACEKREGRINFGGPGLLILIFLKKQENPRGQQ
jgi:hypothetical protein